MSSKDESANSDGGALEAVRPQLAVSNEAQLAAVVEEYLAALKAGRRLDRQAFLARDPALADVLAECLDGLEFIHAAASGLRQPDATSAVASAAIDNEMQPPLPLGDYQIVREIGRGGMGVVYEAQQLSLGRRVALKILPFASALDARQLQRFRNEAQAAAQLQHPHIVPVYAVGYDRGVHYYAMQLIEGKTLADVIADLKSQCNDSERAERPWPKWDKPAGAEPASAETGHTTVPRAGLATERSIRSASYFRVVAELGIQAALALEQAHQIGVVHRDIKPANLMVDMQGKLWVTDFGLARFPNHAELTISGDVVGTLRYMSPEQASAKRVLIDHRTDIYSLGVTLYELLTLQPAFPGNDRRELERQIIQDEPIPLRRVNRAVPAEIETILHKAFAKSPEDRYGTAQELAADLKRFLEDKPIRAQRPSVREKAVKWSRRHKAWLRGAAAMLVLAVVTLTISTLVALRAYEAKAVQEKKRSENLAVALKALDEILKVVEDRLPRDRERQREDQELLQKGLRFYQEFADTNGDDPTVRFETGRAYRRVGDIQLHLGAEVEAEKAYARAIAVLEQLLAESRRERGYREELALCARGQATLWWQIGRSKEAEQAIEQARKAYDQLRVDFPREPDYGYQLVKCRYQLSAMRQATGAYPGAEANLRQNLPILERLANAEPRQIQYDLELAENQRLLAEVLQQTGRVREAEDLYQKAAKVLQPLVAGDSEATLDAKTRLARVYHGLGVLYRLTGRRSESEQIQARCLDLQNELATKLPGLPELQYELAFSQYESGLTLAALGRWQEAERAYNEALPRLRALVGDFPNKLYYRYALGRCCRDGGRLLEHAGKFSQAEQSHREAVTAYEKLAAGSPDILLYKDALAWALYDLAIFLGKQGKGDEAHTLLERAIRQEQAALETNPRQSEYRFNLGQFYQALARRQIASGQHEEAARTAEKSFEAVLDICYLSAARAADCTARCAAVAERDGKLDSAARRLRAQAYVDMARKRLEQAIQRCPNHPKSLNDLAWNIANFGSPPLCQAESTLQLAKRAVEQANGNGDFWNTLGAVYYRAGNAREARDALLKSVELRSGGDSLDYFFLAMALWQLGDKDQARHWYDRGLSSMKKTKGSPAQLESLRAEAGSLLGLDRRDSS
jgi:serine/threonine protein kinase